MNPIPKLFLLIGLLGASYLNASWSLEETINYALEHNPDIRMAQAAVEVAESKIIQAKSAYKPRINLESSYSRTNLPLHAFGSILNQGAFDFGLDFNNPGEVDNLNLTGTVMYQLYDGGSKSARLKASKHSRNASSQMELAVTQQIKFAVIQIWNQIIQSKAQLESQQSNLEAINNSLQVAKEQYDSGKFLKTEVLNLEVQHARAEESLLNASTSLELANQALLNLIGTEDSQVLNLIDPQQDNLYNSYDFETISPQERPEVVAAKEQLKAAQKGKILAKKGKKPEVNAFANYQYNKGFELNGNGDHWMAGVALNYIIYSGGATNARIRESQSQINQSKENLRKTELAIDLEQRTSKIALTNAQKAVDVTSKMVEQAEESANLYRKRFESGVILSSELIDIENHLTDARVRRAQSQSQLNIARANLLRAFGHL